MTTMTGVANASSSASSLISSNLCSLHSTHRSRNQPITISYPRTSPIFPRLLTTLSTVTFARRKKQQTPAVTSKRTNTTKKKSKNTNNKNKKVEIHEAEEGGFDGDALEALFSLLEEDLKNDLSFQDGDEELTEEELAKLERELEEALGDDEELSGMLTSNSGNDEIDEEDDDDEEEDNDNDDEEDNDEDEEEDEYEDDAEEEKPVELKKWQLRRLASALKTGRRKTSIKSLAAELCLDRALVLELLREPPPNLLMLSAALPDRIVPAPSEPATELMEPSTESDDEVLEPEPKADVKLPVHAMQSRWSMQKRLKKVQAETLERVYNRSKRPTNAMISSIVHVTNLPKKRVVQWFEDKRAEDGVPHNRVPFQPSIPTN